MPRRPRNLLPDGVYHVTSRGNGRIAIFLDDADRETFVALLRKTIRELSWRCHVFCLMPNHYHLVLETTQQTLARGMHRLNGSYARSFNERHGRSGHLFANRYGAWLIEDDEHMRTACDYVLANPVRASLCERVEDWPWSGRPVAERGGAGGLERRDASTRARPVPVPVKGRRLPNGACPCKGARASDAR